MLRFVLNSILMFLSLICFVVAIKLYLIGGVCSPYLLSVSAFAMSLLCVTIPGLMYYDNDLGLIAKRKSERRSYALGTLSFAVPFVEYAFRQSSISLVIVFFLFISIVSVVSSIILFMAKDSLFYNLISELDEDESDSF